MICRHFCHERSTLVDKTTLSWTNSSSEAVVGLICFLQPWKIGIVISHRLLNNFAIFALLNVNYTTSLASQFSPIQIPIASLRSFNKSCLFYLAESFLLFWFLFTKSLKKTGNDCDLTLFSSEVQPRQVSVIKVFCRYMTSFEYRLITTVFHAEKNISIL